MPPTPDSWDKVYDDDDFDLSPGHLLCHLTSLPVYACSTHRSSCSCQMYTPLWGSAFPSIVSGPENCHWDRNRKLAICGDFCVSPTVEGAILSGTHAAKKLLEVLSCL